jgi:predicted MFS family arabinose efflux permease
VTRETKPATSAVDARYALVILLAVSVFNQVDRTLLSILQVPMKHDLRLSDVQLGALTGLSFAIVYCTCAVPTSRLADRLPRNRLMAGALVLWSAMTAASGLARSYAVLVFCRMGLALGESCCSPATVSLLSDYFPMRKRALAIAVWTMSIPVGLMFGLGAGGWMASSLGWRKAFIYVGAAGLLLVPTLLVAKEPRRGQHDGFGAPQVGVPSIWDALRILWSTPSLRFMFLGGGLSSYVLNGSLVWSAPFYARVHGMPIREIGLTLALMFGVGGGLGALIGGTLGGLAARRDPRAYGWVPAAAFALLVPVALTQFLAASLTVSLIAGFFSVVLFNVYLAPLTAGIQSLVNPNMRAFSSAILLVFSNLGGLGLSALVTGAISDLLLAEGLGPTSIRYALCSTLLVALDAAAAYSRAGATFARDLSHAVAVRAGTI